MSSAAGVRPVTALTEMNSNRTITDPKERISPELLRRIDSQRMPGHVAVIMDGNGRWAKARGLDRSAGHVEGVNTVRRITRTASDLGVRYLTLYTFSTENWNRPQAEVDALMHLIAIAIQNETPELVRNNVRLRIIGQLDRVPAQARERLQSCLDATSHCNGLTLCLDISYSARWEITEAARRLARMAAAGELDPEAISDDVFAAQLSTFPMPDPDLLLRTGGDSRVSNYLLWQIAYSELLVTPTFWPDFTADEFVRAILQYQGRERRFGLTSEQIK